MKSQWRKRAQLAYTPTDPDILGVAVERSRVPVRDFDPDPAEVVQAGVASADVVKASRKGCRSVPTPDGLTFRVLRAMQVGEWHTVRDMINATGIKETHTRIVLTKLVQRGDAELRRGARDQKAIQRGHVSRWRLTPKGEARKRFAELML